MSLILPTRYSNPIPTAEGTERAIKQVKEMFQNNLSAQLALLRVTAPLAVLRSSGLNDDLNGTEQAVSFAVRARNTNAQKWSIRWPNGNDTNWPNWVFRPVEASIRI